MKALVTGADGFVGRWLVPHLEASGDAVWQAVGSHAPETRRRRRLELMDANNVEEVVRWARPDAIYHLAAVAYGPDASTDMRSALDVTVRGTAYVLEAAARMHSAPTVLIPSSSEVYGDVSTRPVREDRATAPVTLYGATKLAQEVLGLAYHRAGRLPVAVARAFNHIGPGQRTAFVVAAFASQLAAIRNGAAAEPVVRVGNLGAARDFTDVRDVVRAYRLLVASGAAGEPYNVASGRAVRIGAILERLIQMSQLSVEVVVDRERFRPIDVPVMRGSAARLRKRTGWRPEVPLRSTLRDVWGDALQREADASLSEPRAGSAKVLNGSMQPPP